MYSTSSTISMTFEKLFLVGFSTAVIIVRHTLARFLLFPIVLLYARAAHVRIALLLLFVNGSPTMCQTWCD